MGQGNRIFGDDDTPSAVPPEDVLTLGQCVYIECPSGRKVARVISSDVNTVCVGVQVESHAGEQIWDLKWVPRPRVKTFA